MIVASFIKYIRSIPGRKYLNLRFVSKQTPRKHALNKSGLKASSPDFLLILPAITFCLGTWQVKRLKWKKGLIEKMKERMDSPPIPLPEDSSDIDMLEYYKVRVRGTFDYDKEMIITPRQDYSKPKEYNPIQGAHLVVPFQISGSNRRILVNRGFVPKERIDQVNRKEGQLEGEVEITGVIRKDEQISRFVRSMNNPQKYGYWLGRDISMMSEMADTEPIYIDADASSTVPGGPIGGQTIVNIRNQHLQYIITWYFLTVFMLYVWYRHASPHAAKIKVLKQVQNTKTKF